MKNIKVWIAAGVFMLALCSEGAALKVFASQTLIEDDLIPDDYELIIDTGEENIAKAVKKFKF